MRLSGITNIQEAQRYLEYTYIPGHNTKFGVSVREAGDVHKPLQNAEKERYERFFAKERERKVKQDGTIQYKHTTYQIPKGTRLYQGNRVKVLENREGCIEIWSGKVMLKFRRL